MIINNYQCQDKRQYNNYGSAEKASKALRKYVKDRCKAYKWDCCGKYHVGFSMHKENRIKLI